MLTLLTMLPIHGMRLDFFKQLIASNSAQLDKLRLVSLQRLIDNNFAIEELQMQAASSSGVSTNNHERMLAKNRIFADVR